MKRKIKSQSGIALITTIILTSIMLSSVALITKEMADEVINSTRLDNSLIAYYAAEAGLEDAQLAFRYDHDAQISENNDNNSLLDVTKDTNNTPRCVNMDTNTNVPYSDCGKSFSGHYYSLVMWNKTKDTAEKKVLKDDIYEFSLDTSKMSGDNITLRFDQNPNTPAGNGYRIEITGYDDNGNIIDAVKKFTCPDEMGNPIDIFKSDLDSKGAPGKRVIRIKPLYTSTSINCITNPPDGGSGLNPDGTIPSAISGNEFPSVTVKVSTSSASDLITSTTTNIESVGYYGGVARKITATLDRASGNILNIFDYAIYSGSDLTLTK